MEDATNYILNITNVTITSYSESSNALGKATIVPTKIPQPNRSKKAAFSLLVYTDLNFDEVIHEGVYSESENTNLETIQATIFVLRSNVYIDNIDFEREPVDYYEPTLLVQLVYQQDKIIQMTNIDMNITGTIMNSADPFNGVFENITIDSHGLRDGFSFVLNCNYPEASLVNELYFNYIKVFTSKDRQFVDQPNMIFYQGPGNVTILNTDLINHYASFSEYKATFRISKDGLCQPTDGVLQTTMMDNITTSLPNNSIPGSKMNPLAVMLDLSFYRIFKNSYYNQRYINFEGSPTPKLVSIGGPNDELHIKN